MRAAYLDVRYCAAAIKMASTLAAAAAPHRVPRSNRVREIPAAEEMAREARSLPPPASAAAPHSLLRKHQSSHRVSLLEPIRT